jgi:diadenosine tetraphosphatase ApaH/serine/threonine PP2A family protein phosphatase
LDGIEPTDATSEWALWTAREVDHSWRDQMARWPIAMELDGICFCHGSPRADDEILTRATPLTALLDAITDTPASLIVGGHTHQQFIRTLPNGRAVANAGSVGVPYEGRAAAFWMSITDGAPRLRETDYDVSDAVDELRASGFPNLDEAIHESLLEPVEPTWVTTLFEHQAGRAERPDDPPPVATSRSRESVRPHSSER